jgi:hypothetical protein
VLLKLPPVIFLKLVDSLVDLLELLSLGQTISPFNLFDIFEEVYKPLSLVRKGILREINHELDRHEVKHVLLGLLAKPVQV